jgi:RNA polymerase sigma-70 factor (ECF subfamily)
MTEGTAVASLFERGPDRLESHTARNPRMRLSTKAQALLAALPQQAEVDPLDALMQRYAEGDDSVFEQLYQSLSPRLYRFCKRLTRHPPEADDVFQETFLRLHRARATYLSGANVSHWAYAIARSAYLDRLRYWRRRPETLGSTNDAAGELLHAGEQYAPEAQAQAHDLLQVVTNALGRMSEKNRHAYILLREEGLSVKEAAAVLGTSTAVVKQRAHRAYEQLRTALRAAE